MNILLIAPATPNTFWGYKYALRFIRRKASTPPLGLLTVAAMLPKSWGLRLVNLNVTRLRDEDLQWADCVMISAMILELDSVQAVAARCAAFGKPVIGGGPLFATGQERFPHVQHFVVGEAEGIMDELIADIEAGRIKHLYESASRPDLRVTPPPRWDLINFGDYALMPVQFSRGCPFDCEFCDITATFGRTPRTKQPSQIIHELDSLLDAGWRGSVFIVDDNFIGQKRKAKELLRELVAWRARRRATVSFTTEASLNLADSPELLDLMVQAGFDQVFIGIETPNQESLRECAKIQNADRDLTESVRRIQNAGIEVMGGFIVGFDHDGPDIFERQLRFIQEAGIVTAMMGLLTAVPRTRLFQRLKAEGRILCECTGNNLDGILNFVPALDRNELINGYRELLQRLFEPRAFYERARTFLKEYCVQAPRGPLTRRDVEAFIRSLWIMGVWSRGRRSFWRFLLSTWMRNRRAFPKAVDLAIKGYHFRRLAAQI